MSGGSGGQIGGYYFTGMFSIYSSEDVVLSNLEISNNAEYDDLIHILYSHNIELRDSYIFDARADAIDIDISEMTIDNCQFLILEMMLSILCLQEFICRIPLLIKPVIKDCLQEKTRSLCQEFNF